MRLWVLRCLVVCLVAPLLAVVGGVRAEALSVPAGFGVVVTPDDGLAFGVRVSSAGVLGSQVVPVVGLADDTTTSTTCDWVWWLEGPIGGQDFARPDTPGYRWRLKVCVTTETTTGEDCVPQPDKQVVQTDLYGNPIENPDGTYVTVSVPQPDICTPTSSTDTTTTVDEVQGPRLHDDAHKWVAEAAQEALGDDFMSHFENVYWNASPGYNSRQIVGLNTWLAASAEPVEDPDAIRGSAFGKDLEDLTWEGSYTEDTRWPDEITFELTVEEPSSVWSFDDGFEVECEGAGELWNVARGMELAIPDGVNSSGTAAPLATEGGSLCLRSWQGSSVADGDVDLIKLDWVQLQYDFWAVSSGQEALEKWADKGADGVDLPDMGTSCELGMVCGDFGSENEGDSRDFVIGEMQTNLVSDRSVRSDVAPSESPWVGPNTSTSLCEKAGGIPLIGGLIGAACKFIGNWIKLHLTVWTEIWNGVQVVANVVKVFFSAVWDLIVGCATAVGDAWDGITGAWDAVNGFIDDPSGTMQDTLKTLDMIREQLSNPDTALDFVTQVLSQVVGDVLALDMIAEMDEDGNWSLKEDPDWAKWVGRMVCEVLLLVITAGVGSAIKAGLKSTKLAVRIADWLADRRKRADIDNPCEGARVDCIPECTSSFPTGTQVRMGRGDLQPIENVEPGDEVMSYNFRTEGWEPRAVIDQWSYLDTGQMASVMIDDGSIVTATDHHKFWVESTQTWEELKNLERGDTLSTPTGPVDVLMVHMHPPANTLVWELTVETTSNFTVNTQTHDTLVHNVCKHKKAVLDAPPGSRQARLRDLFDSLGIKWEAHHLIPKWMFTVKAGSALLERLAKKYPDVDFQGVTDFLNRLGFDKDQLDNIIPMPGRNSNPDVDIPGWPNGSRHTGGHTDDYYAEIARRIEQNYPDGFPDTPSQADRDAVAAIARGVGDDIEAGNLFPNNP